MLSKIELSTYPEAILKPLSLAAASKFFHRNKALCIICFKLIVTVVVEKIFNHLVNIVIVYLYQIILLLCCKLRQYAFLSLCCGRTVIASKPSCSFKLSPVSAADVPVKSKYEFRIIYFAVSRIFPTVFEQPDVKSIGLKKQ